MLKISIFLRISGVDREEARYLQSAYDQRRRTTHVTWSRDKIVSKPLTNTPTRLLCFAHNPMRLQCLQCLQYLLCLQCLHYILLCLQCLQGFLYACHAHSHHARQPNCTPAPLTVQLLCIKHQPLAPAAVHYVWITTLLGWAVWGFMEAKGVRGKNLVIRAFCRHEGQLSACEGLQFTLSDW